jgi:(p)ppGpp synthase/HD superfamily hydrolase
MNSVQMPMLGDRFEQALLLAARLHRHQRRKGLPVPYVAHLLSVAALVLEDGGDEDEAIAALLHDAVEDQGGAATRDLIGQQFGDRVVAIIEGCTESDQQPKPPWRERKELHLAKLAGASPAVCRVTLADKLHNARSLLADYQTLGEALWGRFGGGREGTIWYYQQMVACLQPQVSGVLMQSLSQAVQQLQLIRDRDAHDRGLEDEDEPNGDLYHHG